MGTIRTLLALTVVLSHSGVPYIDVAPYGGIMFVGGRYAVQLFYMISGYLITHILLSNPNYATDTGRFYLNRALRIYPNYLVVASLTLISVGLLGNGAYLQTIFSIYDKIPTDAAVWLVTSNIILFGQDWLIFFIVKAGHLVYWNYLSGGVPMYTGLWVPQSWTLGVELTFYLIAPFVVRHVWRIALLFVLSIAVRLWLYSKGLGGSHDAFFSYRFFPSELAIFMAGALSRHWLLPLWVAVKQRSETAPIGGTLILFILCATFFLWPGGELIKGLSLFGVFVALMPLAFLFQQRSRIDDTIGALSYPIYICHFLAFNLLFSYTAASTLSKDQQSLAMVIAAILFAILLHVIVDRGIDRIRDRIRSGGYRFARSRRKLASS